jgi:hypothetical protein
MRAIQREAEAVLAVLGEDVKLKLAQLVGASDFGVRVMLEGPLARARAGLIELGVISQPGRFTRLGKAVVSQAAAGIVVDDRAAMDARILDMLCASGDC